MQQQIEKLIQDIVNDYANWQAACAARNADTCSKVQNDMFDRFKSRILLKKARNTLKSLLKVAVYGALLLNKMMKSSAKAIS
jgi:hypothetical protein